MTAKKGILGLVDPSREVRRPPLVGMQFLHEGSVCPPDFLGTGARLKAKDLISLLLRHWPTPRRLSAPRCRISLRVLTPGGLPAVKIRCK